MTTCPHCGGHLYRDPDERVLRCLMCAREFEQQRSELVPLVKGEPPVLKTDGTLTCSECGQAYPYPRGTGKISGRCARCAGRANVAARVSRERRSA